MILNVNPEKAENGYPLFSIGVTTYNRIDLLKQTIRSLINQDFADFEIIIGNDFPDEQLTYELIGIFDSRIKIINNEKNLGELDNMNSLLLHAKGRYFSWIFDDDLCHPSFLREIYKSLILFDYPDCVFTSYKFFYGTSEFKFIKEDNKDPALYTGKEFLRRYLSGSLRTLGLGGFHKTDYLIKAGGAHRLTNGHMAVYSEYLLLVQDGLVSKIAYINAPLNMVRVHYNSWSKDIPVELFVNAGVNLIKESIEILSKKELKEDFQRNLESLLKSVISVIVVKSSSGLIRINRTEINDSISSLGEILKLMENNSLYNDALKSLYNAKKKIPFFLLKARIKGLIPYKLLGFVHFCQYYFLRFTNKSF
jgi:glycosyltransferase involved in cell wall biosynthesis